MPVISLYAVGRLIEHREGSPWFKSIARITVENFPSRSAALAAETAAIRGERPFRAVPPPSSPGSAATTVTIEFRPDMMGDAQIPVVHEPGILRSIILFATGITAYLEAGGTLENAQAMAAHESPRTTKLYDRTGDEITLDEVERIQI
jgi:hypothetical protein